VKLANTTVFQLALRFSIVFTIISVTILLSVYYITILEIETQTERELLHEIAELDSHYNQHGFDSLKELVNLRDQYGQHLHHYYSIIDNNTHVAGTKFLIKVNHKADYERFGISFHNFAKYFDADGHEVIIRYGEKELSNGMSMLVGQAQNSLTELQEHTITAIFYAVLVTLALSIIIGIYMGKEVLSRIKVIDSGMQEAISTDFKQLLAVPKKEDEFQSLTTKLNAMLERIDDLIIGMRQVTDNIAHDLRSPLTRMKSRLEVTLLKERDSAEYRHIMESTIKDCDDLLNTFNSLLCIAQLESGINREPMESINISELCDELADLYQAVAEESHLTFTWNKPDDIYIRGSRQLFAQAINNMLENAVKYTPQGGHIELIIDKNSRNTTVTVNDTGPGIPVSSREDVLKRFKRLDSARSKTGNGLGLSLVNAIAKLHNANLVLDNNNPGLSIKLIFKND